MVDTLNVHALPWLFYRYLERSFNAFSPDILIYNAGTDILDGDPLGCLSITPEGIIERDEIVFRFAFLA